MLGPGPVFWEARRWLLCHLWPRGNVHAWTRLQDAPRPDTGRSRAIWRFISPRPGKGRYGKHSHPHSWASEEKPPFRSDPSWETGLHGPGNKSPCQVAGPSLPWAPTWAQPGCCRRAPAVSPARADAGPALFALSQPGLCVRDPRAPRGREGSREVDGRVEAGRG